MHAFMTPILIWASGMDLGLQDMHSLSCLLWEFVGGQAKVAPEHQVDLVLRLMLKPGFKEFEAFFIIFARELEKTGKQQYVSLTS